MNIYALFPLVATIAYIALIITTLSNRPWRRQHELFILFLVPALMWSLTDVFLRTNLFPQHNFLLFEVIMITFPWMCVQLHCFTSSFFAPGQGRWLPFAYSSLAAIIALVLAGYITEGITASGGKLYPEYGNGTIVIAVVLLTLVGRNLYVFGKRLKILDNPVLYNQIISLMVGISFLAVFALTVFLPWGREYPISHFGSLINAFILSYAIIRHQLVDIRFILRRALAWLSLVVIGGGSFGALLSILHTVFRFELDLVAIFVATLVAIFVAVFTYNLRDYLFTTVSKAFQGRRYDYRRDLSNFANKIQNVFTLKQQGGELLALITKAVGCKWASLLFLEAGSEDFDAQLIEPKGRDNPLSGLKLRRDNPIVEYLGREQKPLTSETLAIRPEFRGLWELEKSEMTSNEIEMFVPLISRDRLIGILALGKRQSGKYSLEDFNLLEDVLNRVAVSIEKEYLREQLREREEELSVINRCSTILTSSFDVQRIYDSFIGELKKIVEVSWSAITLIEPNDLCILALSSEIGSAWQVGERLPVKGTATQWLATHEKVMVESDLSKESKFSTGKYHLKQGVRSIVYLPLIAKGRVIGSLVVASRHPNAYSQRHVILLEQLASQIAMPVENSRLYAEVEERARTDELTGLLNRRALDELIVSEIGRHSRYGGIFSIIILDLDSFKVFNDKYGHLAGDKVLKQTGDIMRNTIRGADQAFRYGGDEFAILLPQTKIEAAYEVAERLRNQIASKVEAGDILITASLGLASWPIDAIVPNEIIAVADASLYFAKRGGGNQAHRASVSLPSLDETMVGYESNEDTEALNTIYALSATVDAKDHYTSSHSERVSEYAMALAVALNLEPEKVSRLKTCASMHDIGKISISGEILNKWDKLTAEEWEEIKTHPQVGATIISHARQLAPCVAGILHHHERYDGGGYPKGLKGEDIPLEARILAIADAFAAMTSNRSYAKALSCEGALEEMKRGAGKQFDPKLIEAFVSIVKISPVATQGER